MRRLGQAISRWLSRHQRAIAVLAGTGLVVAGVAMVFVPAAFILAGAALVGFFGIDFGRAR